MVIGYLAKQALKQDFRPQMGWSHLPPDIPAFSIEMIRGWHPDSPNIFLAPRIPLPVSQTTQVNAAISVEMFQGLSSEQQRRYQPIWNIITYIEPDTGATAIRDIIMMGFIPFPR
jgi:hypothetical protein